MICIFHDKDLDGHCAAAIVKYKYPEAKLIGYDYGRELDMSQIPKGEDIIMVDVSMPMQQMFDLSVHSNHNMLWIDHHHSAIEDYKQFIAKHYPDLKHPNLHPFFYTAHVEVGRAACELTWEFLFPEQPIPKAVLLLGMYDTWRNQDQDKWENEILPFQYGMRLRCNSPENFPGYYLLERPAPYLVTEIIVEGLAILKYQREQNARAAKAAFVIDFEGLRTLCLNTGGANSEVFKTVYDESLHDMMMTFSFTGRQWRYTLYGTKPEVDCSVIAKLYGGGGHKHACGFKSPDLLDQILEITIPE